MEKNAKTTKNGTEEKVAFVISPIGDQDSPERKRADQILKHVIEPTVKEFKYKTVRADKISKPGIITNQIIDHIMNDELVIADLTGHNPNVFYELAVRHVIQKPIIQIIQKGEKIPFDVSTQRTIEIDHKDLDSAEEARNELQKQIKAVEKDPSLVDSPISSAVDLKLLKQSKNPEQTAIASIQAALSDLSTEMKEIRLKLDMRDLDVRNLSQVYSTDFSVINDYLKQMTGDKDYQKRFDELLKRVKKEKDTGKK